MYKSRLLNAWHHLFDNKHLNHFYAFTTIRWFGVALFFIFLPGYLYELGYGLRHIALFFMLWMIAHALSVFLAARIASKKSVKFLISATLPLLVIFMITLPLLKQYPVLFYIIPLFGGCNASLFWVGYHLFFSYEAESSSRGRKISALVFISGIAMMVAPAIGGYFIEKFGSTLVILVIPVFIILSWIPLKKIPTFSIPKTWTHKTILNKIKTPQGAAFLSAGASTLAYGIFWPLYLFIILNGYVVLGIVSFATSLFSLIMNLFAGYLNDKKGDKKLLIFGSFCESFLWVARFFASTPLIAVIIDALDKTTNRFYSLAFDARSYHLAEDSHVEIILQREFWTNVGGVLSAVLIIMFPYFGVVFAVAAIGSLWSMLL